MTEEFILGTEAKILLSVNRIEGYNAYEYEWHVDVYTNPRRKVRVSKYDCTPIVPVVPAEQEDNGTREFYVPVDTAELGVGEITADLVAYIPDTDFSDGLRTEIVRFTSLGVVIP